MSPEALNNIQSSYFIIGVFLSASLVMQRLLNPLKCSDVRWLHFKVFNAIQV